jgi:hypothetical protein
MEKNQLKNKKQGKTKNKNKKRAIKEWLNGRCRSAEKNKEPWK